MSASSRWVPTTVIDWICSACAGASTGWTVGVTGGGATCAKAGLVTSIVPLAANAVEAIKYMPKVLLVIVIRSDVRPPPGCGLMAL